MQEEHYHLPYWSEERNYSKYPKNTVTYPEDEPFIKCDYCFKIHSTNAKVISYPDGIKTVSYVPANTHIIYERLRNKYICTGVDTEACIRKQREIEKLKQEKAALVK